MNGIGGAIRKRGFRKWYERELIAGHSHLVLLVLATLALLGALEAFSDRTGSERLWMAASFATAGVVGVWALRRYLFHLMRAESAAHQAVCPGCRAYARWRVEGDDEPEALAVCCRDCGTRWRIHL